MTAVEWVFLILAVIIFGPPAAFLVHGALTGRRPSAAEVARAVQIAATPAHPSVRGWGHLSKDERQEFGEIVSRLKRPADETERQS